MNVEPPCRILTSNRKSRRRSVGFAFPLKLLYPPLKFSPASSCPLTRSLSSLLRYLATASSMSLARNSPTYLMAQPTRSCFMPVTPCATGLLPLHSRKTIRWHRQCNAILPATHSVLRGWHMAQQTTVEAQVIDVMRHTRMCDLEEVTRQCTDLTWNQVFLAVDRLSRSGKIILVPRGRGLYTVTFPHQQDGRLDRHSLPS